MTQILLHTPAWVFLLLLGLVAFGVYQSKERSISRTRLPLLPAILVAFSGFGVWKAFGTNYVDLLGWAVGMAAAIGCYRGIRSPRTADFVPEADSYIVPGTWLPLFAILFIFATRFVTIVSLIGNPSLGKSMGFVATASACYGFGSGLFVGRALRISKVARERPISPA